MVIGEVRPNVPYALFFELKMIGFLKISIEIGSK